MLELNLCRVGFKLRSAEDVYEELEGGRAIRETEVRLLLNLSSETENEERRNSLRRMLVLITYAHLEGYAKFALDSYASAINSAKLSCSEAVWPLVAATLHRAFAALREINSRHPVFSRTMPDDSALHMAWREHKFVEQMGELMQSIVSIPDSVIDTQSNLTPPVLKRNLYRLGLSVESVDPHGGSLHKLVGKRNQISHGELVVPKDEELTEYIETAFKLMQFVQAEIYEALRKKAYQRIQDA